MLQCHRYVIERRKGQPGGVAPEALSTLPVPYKVYWVMHSICLPSSVVVTAIFWAVVYDPGMKPDFNLTLNDAIGTLCAMSAITDGTLCEAGNFIVYQL